MRTARSSSPSGGVSTRHPPGAGTPQEQAPPWDQTPPGPDHPPQTWPPPGTRPPCEQNDKQV